MENVWGTDDRLCHICWDKKPKEAFKTDKTNKCIACTNKARREKRATPEVRAQRKVLNAFDHKNNAEQIRERHKRNRRNKPNQAEAQKAGNKLAKTTCEVADCTYLVDHPDTRLEAHHDSYAEGYWDKVKTLCSRHHTRRTQCLKALGLDPSIAPTEQQEDRQAYENLGMTLEENGGPYWGPPVIRLGIQMGCEIEEVEEA